LPGLLNFYFHVTSIPKKFQVMAAVAITMAVVFAVATARHPSRA
jgi:hypothetical protein